MSNQEMFEIINKLSDADSVEYLIVICKEQEERILQLEHTISQLAEKIYNGDK